MLEMKIVLRAVLRACELRATGGASEVAKRRNITFLNRYVIWGRMAWGRLVEEELYEDTLRTEALDQYQPSRGSTAASPS